MQLQTVKLTFEVFRFIMEVFDFLFKGIHCVLSDSSGIKADPNYEEAKNGNYFAAKQLVNNLCKEDKIKKLVAAYPDAVVVPIATKGNGHNQIPVAYADKLGESGMEFNHDILINKKANHTQKSEIEQLISQNEFDGKVEKQRKYVIVDDVVTNGGSINGLRHYIEDNGGSVVAASTLSAGKGSTEHAPSKKTIDAVYSKHGEAINDYLKSIGIEDGVESLTNREANLLRSMNPDRMKPPENT